MMGSDIEIRCSSCVAASRFHDHRIINAIQVRDSLARPAARRGIRFECEYFPCACSYFRKPQSIITDVRSNISNNRNRWEAGRS